MTGPKLWAVSPYNPAPTAGASAVSLHDCTIREGEQQPGYSLTADQRVRVAHAIAEAGIAEIEVGIPARGPAHRDIVAAVARAGVPARLTAVCRAELEQVRIAIDCGVGGVLCSVPADPYNLKHKAKMTEEEAIERAIEATRYVHDHGAFVILSLAYATRADLPFLTRLLATVVRDGHADRVRVVDSAGCATPEAIALLVRMFRHTVDRPVEVHCHDDFGLAVMNSIAAVQAGASVVSCSVAGVGPRAGNAALEEVVLALELLYGRRSGVPLDRLVPLVRLVEAAFGIRQAPYKAVSGPNLLELSEIAKVGTDEEPLVSQAFLPSLVGHPIPS